MSAFIVGQDHIDFLVTAAVDLSTGYGCSPLYWQQEPGQPRGMWPRLDLSTADAFGQMLLAENIASVQYRYEDCEYADLPGPIHKTFPFEYKYRRFSPFRGRELKDIAQVLKAISCYKYQSCEHPGWQESEAKRMCDHLASAYIHRLPGYEDAEWEVRRPALATAR